MSGLTEDEILIRNLKDAGCSEEEISRYLSLEAEGREKEQLRLLSIHRVKLLDQVHASQEMLDCLDYLIYTMKKKNDHGGIHNEHKF